MNDVMMSTMVNMEFSKVEDVWQCNPVAHPCIELATYKLILENTMHPLPILVACIFRR